MNRTKLLLSLAVIACGSGADRAGEVVPAQPRTTASPAAAPHVAPLAQPPARPVSRAAAVAAASAGPACLAFLSCCSEVRDRLRVAADCEAVVAEGEATCASALRNYRGVPEPYRSRLPAACTGGTSP